MNEIAKKHKNPNGSRKNKPHYLAEVFKMNNEGRWILKCELIN